MNWLDWLVVISFCAIIMIIGLMLSRRAGKSMTDFFLAGRKMPWWLAGFSMIATNFASDTPLHMSGRARTGGLGNFWFYLRGIFMQLSVAFIFAKLWRRANILTEVEFLEIRHGSKGGRSLRVALAVFNALVFAPFKIGLFTLAMSSILRVILELPENFNIFGITVNAGVFLSICIVLFALVYCTSSGFWGVVVTDFFESIISFAGMYVLLFMAYKTVGGPSGLVQKLAIQTDAGNLSRTFTSFVPAGWWKSFAFLLIFSPLFWFNDGEAATAQRLMACRSEKDAMLSQLFRCIANYIFRSWPWIITGLASILVIPALDDPDLAYPAMIRELLPHGLIGLMLASFISAFLSSADTYMNLGTSFFVNDIYRRYLAREKTESHYVVVSRIATVALAVYSIIIAIFSSNVFVLFTYLMKILAGVHVIRVLRWFWWRVNAAAEITSIISAMAIASAFEIWNHQFTAGSISLAPPARLIIEAIGNPGTVFSYNVVYFIVDYSLITVLVTLFSLTVMTITKHDPIVSLQQFYRRIRPAGPGWKPIARLCPEVTITDSLFADLAAWAVGTVFVFAAIFTAGGCLLAKWMIVPFLLILCAITGIILWRLVLPRYERLAKLDQLISQNDQSPRKPESTDIQG